jgi:hypothetical protein
MKRTNMSLCVFMFQCLSIWVVGDQLINMHCYNI